MVSERKPNEANSTVGLYCRTRRHFADDWWVTFKIDHHIEVDVELTIFAANHKLLTFNPYPANVENMVSS